MMGATPRKTLLTMLLRSMAWSSARLTRTSLKSGLVPLRFTQRNVIGLMLIVPSPFASHCSFKTMAPSKESVSRSAKSTSPASIAGQSFDIARLKSVLQDMPGPGAQLLLLNGIGLVVKSLPVNRDGTVVGSFDFLDQVGHQPIAQGKFRMAVRLPAELEVVGGVGFAIVPSQARS